MTSANQTESCLHCYVSGRVQGVFYRASARVQAETLGLTGYARNLADGRVEIYACGEIQALEAFKDWLWHGPPHAQVSSVVYETQEYEVLEGFRIRY